MKRFADKIGAEYALFPLAAPHYDTVQSLLARLLWGYAKETTIRVLEIGCGTGITTRKIADLLPTATIVAIDNEEVMLMQARKNFIGNTRTEFVQADALTYLQDQVTGAFDAVATAFCLHNTSPQYRKACFEEIGRITSPGGIIISADKIAQDNILEHWKALKEQIDAFGVFHHTHYPELQAEWTSHYLEDDRQRFTEKEQVELLELSGCGEIMCNGRWRMDALFSGIRK